VDAESIVGRKIFEIADWTPLLPHHAAPIGAWLNQMLAIRSLDRATDAAIA
jgi:hypothetical protein